VVAVSLDVIPAEVVPKVVKYDGPEVPREAEGVPEEDETPKVTIEKPEEKPKSVRQVIYEDLLKNF
jgi:hypothetical protein